MLLMADAEAEPAAGGLQQRFEGKTVLITGAGGELGREGAVYFATHGANVIALDLGAAALGQTLAAVRSANPEAKCVTAACDVCDRASVQAAVKAGVAAFGRIDLCWNNAGVQGAMVPTLDYPPADFEQTLQVNVVGAFHVLQAVGGAMRESGGGAIVNTASAAALRGTPTMVAYVASKAAIVGMTLSAAKDLAPHRIRVNAVSPALIESAMWERQNSLHAASGSPFFAREPAQVGAAKLSSVPMRRLGSSSEVVRTVAFLLSEEASYTTGANLVVSGGLV